MKQYGLPKQDLLRKPEEFRLVYRLGERLHGKGYTLVYMPNGSDGNRLGISIHRKLRGAVRRNRIKRMIREVFRLHRDIFPGSSDIVFSVRPDFPFTSSESIRAAIAARIARKKGPA